jgi:hypothetical protein
MIKMVNSIISPLKLKKSKFSNNELNNKKNYSKIILKKNKNNFQNINFFLAYIRKKCYICIRKFDKQTKTKTKKRDFKMENQFNEEQASNLMFIAQEYANTCYNVSKVLGSLVKYFNYEEFGEYLNEEGNYIQVGKDMYEFIKDTFLQWGIAKKTVDYISIKEHFDDVIKGHIIGDFYDFREYFVDFMLGNKDKIEKGEWV